MAEEASNLATNYLYSMYNKYDKNLYAPNYAPKNVWLGQGRLKFHAFINDLF